MVVRRGSGEGVYTGGGSVGGFGDAIRVFWGGGEGVV